MTSTSLRPAAMHMPLIPHDADAERGVIGACLIDPDRAAMVALKPSDFYVEMHGEIFAVIQTMARQGRRADYLTVTAALEAQGNMDATLLLGKCISHTPTAAALDSYAEVVKERAARRAIIRLAGEMAGAAYNLSDAVAPKRAEWLAQLVDSFADGLQSEPLAVFAAALWDEVVERADNPQEIYGIPTGFHDLDHLTKGLQSGEVFLLCGQPGVGKSLLAAQAAMQMAQAGHAGVYYALEMKGVAIVRRMVSALTNITTARMRGGFVNEADKQAIGAAVGALCDIPLFLSDKTQWDSITLRGDLARRKAKHNIKFAVVDHLTLLKDTAHDPLEREKIMSQSLHDTAKDLGIAILGIHTMNKTGIRNGSNPSLADSAGSVKLTYDADIIGFFTEHLPQDGEMKQEHLRTLTLAKFREDESNKYFHLRQSQVMDERGRPRGLPRFEDY